MAARRQLGHRADLAFEQAALALGGGALFARAALAFGGLAFALRDASRSAASSFIVVTFTAAPARPC
jgi:hypothetical protein